MDSSPNLGVGLRGTQPSDHVPVGHTLIAYNFAIRRYTKKPTLPTIRAPIITSTPTTSVNPIIIPKKTPIDLANCQPMLPPKLLPRTTPAYKANGLVIAMPIKLPITVTLLIFFRMGIMGFLITLMGHCRRLGRLTNKSNGPQ